MVLGLSYQLTDHVLYESDVLHSTLLLLPDSKITVSHICFISSRENNDQCDYDSQTNTTKHAEGPELSSVLRTPYLHLHWNCLFFSVVGLWSSKRMGNGFQTWHKAARGKKIWRVEHQGEAKYWQIVVASWRLIIKTETKTRPSSQQRAICISWILIP
jgi:hypothetical protein